MGFCVWSLFCYAVLSVLSSFAIILRSKRERERAGCFTFIVVLMSCDCYCSVGLPHGAVEWAAACDCDIFPGHTHLRHAGTFLVFQGAWEKVACSRTPCSAVFCKFSH